MKQKNNDVLWLKLVNMRKEEKNKKNDVINPDDILRAMLTTPPQKTENKEKNQKEVKKTLGFVKYTIPLFYVSCPIIPSLPLNKT